MTKRRSRFWHLGRVHWGWSRSTPTDTLNLTLVVSQKNKETYPANAQNIFEVWVSFTSKNPPNRRKCDGRG